MTTDMLRGTWSDELDGTVTRPGDVGWDDARRPWSAAVDQQPCAVVHATSVADVRRTVRFAAANGLSVAAQPRGHGATRALDGAVLLRTGGLDELTVDAGARTARIGAGVPWGRVMAELDALGLVGLAGSNPGVTAVPYLLGGGLSWFGRAHGVAAVSLRAVDLVDAHGDLRHVDADSDPDLLWALRGGGGDFGIVTAAEIDLFPAAELYGGRLAFADADAGAVLRAFAGLTQQAPDRLTAWFSRMHFPPAPHLPDELRGHSFCFVDVVHLGAAEEAEALLGLVRSAGTLLRETVRHLTPGQVGTVTEEPSEGMPSIGTTCALSGLDAETAEALLARTGRGSGVALLSVRHLGGAMTSAQPPLGAGTRVDAPYAAIAMGMALDPAQAARTRQALSDLQAGLAPWAVPTGVLTFLPEGAPLSAIVDAATVTRLQEIKRAVDPAGVFSSNHPVLDG